MRIEAKVDLADFTLFKGLVATLMFVMGLVRAQRTTLARLRRFFGFSSSEKTAEVLAEDDKSTPVPPPRAGSEPAGATGSAGATEPAGATGSAGATEPAKRRSLRERRGLLLLPLPPPCRLKSGRDMGV